MIQRRIDRPAIAVLALILAIFSPWKARALPAGDMEREDAMVYSSFWQQKIYAERCVKACPALAGALREAELEFSSRFGPAVDRVEKLQAKPGESVEDVRSRMRAHWEEDADKLVFDCAPCNHTLALIRSRAAGKAGSPLAEALLRNHPRYADRPELMMEDGFIKRLAHTDPTSSLELVLDYPASWLETRAPAGASAVYSDYGHGFERLLIFSTPHPALIEEDATPELAARVLEESVDELMDERWCGEEEGCPAGKLNMDGRPARWFVQKREKPGVYFMQTLWVYTVIEGRFIGLQMDVRSASPRESAAAVEKRFKKYIPVFLKMAESAKVKAPAPDAPKP